MDSWEEDSNDNESCNDEFQTSGDQETESNLLKSNKRIKNQANTKLKKVKYEDISTETQKKSKKKSELYKAPTVEELNNLKETENLYNNNLFRLQISELIKEISIKKKRKKVFSTWFETFKQLLDDCPKLDDFTLSQIKSISKKKLTRTEQFINNISSTYSCYIKTDQDLTLKLSKPIGCQTFGLQEIHSCPGPSMDVSIAVIMPRSFFNVKDFVNNRYLVKRFYYLLYVADNISAFKKSMSVHEDVTLLPVIDIQPTEDEKIKVKIYAFPPEGYFKLSRFLPNINNVKQDLFESNIYNIEVLQNTPTILYNSVLAHDVTLQTNTKYVKTVLSEYSNIQEGIKLLSVWLKQKELNIGFGAFKESLLVYLVTFLFGIKKLNKLMSSYQVIRNVWSFLANTDLSNHTICLGDSSNDTIKLFKQNFSVVILDCTSCYNLASFLSIGMLKKVITESQIALKQLDSGRMESFQLLFLNKLPFSLQYDLVLNISPVLPLTNLNTQSDEDKSKTVGFELFSGIKYISQLIQEGLNHRIVHIVPRIETQYPKGETQSIKKVLFGINLDPERAFSFIEKGPALIDHIEAEKFRKFWGNLSSDRRFRDGSTHVAVYFKTTTVRAKRNIIKRIIKFILTEKLQLKFKIYYDEMEEYLINKRIKAPYPVGTNEEACLKIITLSDELGQKIRSLEMSLSITGILGLSNAYCYTEASPPIASSFDMKSKDLKFSGNNMVFSTEKVEDIQRYVKPIEQVLHLEHSSKWPNNLQGIRHIKTSFFLEISSQLQNAHNILSHVTQDHLDIYYQGLVFRYLLFVPKEIAFMKKELTDSGSVKYTQTLETSRIEQDLTVLPKIIGALKGLQLQHPSFGSGTALIKKWLRSQLIDHVHISDIQIDLLSASLYLGNSQYMESCTPQICFLRFLKFICELQCDLQPVIVNFNDELSNDDLAELETKFQQNRASLQPLYIIMPQDQGQSLFTKESPSKEILDRIKQLAAATLNLLIDRMSGNGDFDLQGLFTPNMDGYDVIIHLNPAFNSRQYESIEKSEANQVVLEKYVQSKNEKIPVVGFSPVDLYLKDLRSNYGEFATFFHNTYGGNCIGVLWNPSAYKAKDFKVIHVNGRKLQNNKLVLNIDAIIEDFYLIGKDLVTWIEKK